MNSAAVRPKGLDEKKSGQAFDRFDPDAPDQAFIRKAVFPKFKNIEERATILFDTPITALVGANGTGKSSILHALWGMPLGYSTSRFWFSTPVDPISQEEDGDEEVEGKGGINRYWYSHWIPQLSRFVQSRKTHAFKRVGYWEPAKPSRRDGMKRMPPLNKEDAPYRSSDRWNQVKRNVLYINFKCEFSAFDRFFYFDDGQTLESKQERYLKGATRLKRVLQDRKMTYSPGHKEAVFEHRQLDEVELQWISFVLGRRYDGAQYLRHRLLTGTESPTVVFSRKGFAYSEAVAGSGELAIVRAVIQLLKVTPSTLILLDEPETSLHPGAQRSLMDLLFHLYRTKKVQVVMSTHSPTIVETLPAKGVKVLEETKEGKSRILDVPHVNVAFNRLGHESAERITIAVEDELLKALVRLALIRLDEGERELFDLHVPPGGASAILKHQIPVWLSSNAEVFAILDGDQCPSGGIPSFNDLSQAQVQALPGRMLELFGCEPDYVGSNADSARDYLKWTNHRLRFLQDVCPEMVLLKVYSADLSRPVTASTNEEAKAALVGLLEEQGHPTDAASLAASVSYIIPNRGVGHTVIDGLHNLLVKFVADHAARS